MSKALNDLMNKKRLKMEDLTVIKFALQNQIDVKQQQLVYLVKNLNPLSKQTQIGTSNPLSLLKVPRRSGKILSIIAGLVTGIKLFNNIRDIIKCKKK